MKNTIDLKYTRLSKFVLALLLSFSSLMLGQAQVTINSVSKKSFIEWNIGLANVTDGNDDDPFNYFLFPGTSVLYGTTYINENNTVFEYEVGLAFPSIVTGKLGVGKKIGSTILTVGVRPFPFNFYGQTSFSSGSSGDFILSYEYNPLDSERFLSVGSKSIVSIGYRWNLTSSKQ